MLWVVSLTKPSLHVQRPPLQATRPSYLHPQLQFPQLEVEPWKPLELCFHLEESNLQLQHPIGHLHVGLPGPRSPLDLCVQVSGANTLVRNGTVLLLEPFLVQVPLLDLVRVARLGDIVRLGLLLLVVVNLLEDKESATLPLDAAGFDSALFLVATLFFAPVLLHSNRLVGKILLISRLVFGMLAHFVSYVQKSSTHSPWLYYGTLRI